MPKLPHKEIKGEAADKKKAPKKKPYRATGAVGAAIQTVGGGIQAVLGPAAKALNSGKKEAREMASRKRVTKKGNKK